MKLIEHFIRGKNYPGNSKRKSKVFDPATGKQSAEVKLATKEDVNKAVENAKMHLKHGRIHLLFKERELCLNLRSL